MGDIGNGGKWYAFSVAAGKEEKEKELILSGFRDKGIQVIIPQRRVRERKNGIWGYRVRKLLPGYILLNGNMSAEDYCSLQDIPGLPKALKERCEPYEIDEQEIGVILTLIRYGEIIGSSYIYPDENGRIIVIDGPLLGLESLIESVNKEKGRAKVRFSFLGEARITGLSVSILQPI